MGICSFCGFRRSSINAKGAYFHDHDTVFAKIQDAVERGATEIYMQSGLTPELNVAFYDSLFREIKERWPTLHLHALSPEEIRYIAQESGRSVEDVLRHLKDAGLGTMPGTAAEILVEEVRRILCPEKLTSQELVEIIKTAHRVGIPTTSTIMYGHIETPWHRLQHLEVIRNLQRETGGSASSCCFPSRSSTTPLASTTASASR